MGEYTLADQERVFTYNWYNIVPPPPMSWIMRIEIKQQGWQDTE